MFLGSVSLRLFGKLIAPHAESMTGLRDTLKKARMQVPVHEFLSVVTLVSVITFVVSLVIGLMFSVLLSAGFLGGFFVAFLSIVAAIVAWLVGYSYPGLEVKNMRNRMDRALPFAVFYMATTSSSGSHPINIFRMLSLRGGIIGEEANRIYTSVKALGMDINTALEKAAMRSPSSRFSELLWGMSSVITTGGDLENYLKDRTRMAMNHYRRSLDDYAKAIALYTEIYITLIIVGSLFFIILLAIIAPLVGGNLLFLQTFLVFFFIPLVSAGFIMLLRGSSPNE